MEFEQFQTTEHSHCIAHSTMPSTRRSKSPAPRRAKTATPAKAAAASATGGAAAAGMPDIVGFALGAVAYGFLLGHADAKAALAKHTGTPSDVTHAMALGALFGWLCREAFARPVAWGFQQASRLQDSLRDASLCRPGMDALQRGARCRRQPVVTQWRQR